MHLGAADVTGRVAILQGAGIALDNEEPARTHIHTIVRTPNGNDYGKDLLKQHYAQYHQELMKPSGAR